MRYQIRKTIESTAIVSASSEERARELAEDIRDHEWDTYHSDYMLIPLNNKDDKE